MSLISAVVKLFNRLAQNSVSEIEDGLTTSDSFKALCRAAIAEGAVLLKNEGVLPLEDKPFALFGRCQINTFYVGYGSGGDVKPPYRVSILDGLRAAGANLDEEVARAYEAWTKAHVPDEGYWGHWPHCYEEMPLEEEFVKRAATRCATALFVIGRAAGEDRDNVAEKGSWFLTDEEGRALALLRKHFQKVGVVLNIGSIMDLACVEEQRPDAVLCLWQGGQETGNGAADVLLGTVAPSGRLGDTLAAIEDYPSSAHFGKEAYNEYAEDIYVGYRYFETFAREKVRYPFGFGLSYTDFALKDCRAKRCAERTVALSFSVENRGMYKGKEVVELYLGAPQGKLGKPARVLVGYVKTKELAPGEGEECAVEIDLDAFASYDDTGATGHRDCFVLEEGVYTLFAGKNVRDAEKVFDFTLGETLLVKQCQEACAPRLPFRRMINANGRAEFQEVPLSRVDLRERILSRLPAPLPAAGKRCDFDEVVAGKISLEAFVAELSEEELETLTRGSLYQMHSPYGPKGNAGTFGASSPSLFEKKVPALSTNDGPSGARLQAHSTLLPGGASLACSFNDALVEALACEYGKEVRARNSHVVLAPGMNLHRNPLCGRNFEYFSEDPYLTGKIAAAYVKGIQAAGVSATPKHFACNNQEAYRSKNDSRVSLRALRELYLKGFEICIEEAKPDCLMTSYNKINGVFSYYNYELATTILRDEWGYEGMVMTDWWMKNDKSPLFETLETQAYRVRAQVDVFMPGAARVGKYRKKSDGTLLRSLHAKDGVRLAELQRSAINVLKLCLKYAK